MRRTSIMLAALIAVSACAGKDGAAGPTGPQGPQGPPGPQGTAGLPGPAGASANKLTLTAPAVFSSGIYSAIAVAPASVGTDRTRPPAVACYIAQIPADGVWLTVAGSPSASGTYCGAVFNSSGTWTFIVANLPPGWTAAFVIAY